MGATMDFEVSWGTRPAPSAGEGEGPMRVVVLADFQGGGTRPPLEQRRTVLVDIDNFDRVLDKVAPRAEVGAPGGGPPLAVGFRELDDFHPDRLYRRLEPFQRLRRLRESLQSEAGFEGACAELRGLVQGLPQEAEGGPPASASALRGGAEGDEATLERLLGQAVGTRAEPRPRDPVAAVVEKLIAGASSGAPPSVPGAKRQVYLEGLDGLAGSWMNAVLHDGGVQRLEAVWRSLHALVSNVETGEELSVHLLDVTRQELDADFEQAGGDLRRSGCWKALGGPGADAPGSPRWSLLAGAYEFGPAAPDAPLLGALGALGAWFGAPFLGAALPELLGCADAQGLADPPSWAPLPPAWQALRKSAAARWLGLALPRLLLRLPYGAKRDEIESFRFDELAGEGEKGVFLWGNPVFGCTRLLAEGFQQSGWETQPGDVLELGDLPTFLFERDGERRMLPCAEAWLGERAGQALLGQGLMPFLSRRDRNAARLLRFQSLADPPEGLSGPWG